MKNKKTEFKIVLEPSRDGGYAVHVPALRSCHTPGDSVREAIENTKDAIKTYLRTADDSVKELREIWGSKTAREIHDEIMKAKRSKRL